MEKAVTEEWQQQQWLEEEKSNLIIIKFMIGKQKVREGWSDPTVATSLKFHLWEIIEGIFNFISN